MNHHRETTEFVVDPATTKLVYLTPLQKSSNMNLDISTTLSEDQLKTILNEWFIRNERMVVTNIRITRTKEDRPCDSKPTTTVVVSSKKQQDQFLHDGPHQR